MTALAALLLAAAPAVPAWPAGLADGVTAIAVTRTLGGKTRTARVRLLGGVWQMSEPVRGEADPDSLTRLFTALHAPEVVGTFAKTAAPRTFVVRLTSGKATKTVVVHAAPLGAPIPVEVGRARFLVSPVELGQKIPDPDDLAPPCLWCSAHGRERSVKVEGRVSYAAHVGAEGAWVSDDGRTPLSDLDDVAGVITGRQKVGITRLAPAKLGLDHPVAHATLCLKPILAGDEAECRTFAFGRAKVGGVVRTYAQGPKADPIELREDAWRLLVEGPFVRR